jgi:hypothetical protein
MIVSRYTEGTTECTKSNAEMIVLSANRLYTPQEEVQNALLFIEDGVISAVSSRAEREIPKNATTVDFGDAILAPGFVDIHMHGGAGLDVMRATPAELPKQLSIGLPTTAMACKRGHWVFISKVRFSATSAAACILRNIWLSPPSKSSTGFGRRPAATCAC